MKLLGQKTILGYQSVDTIELADDETLMMVTACKPGRPYCYPAFMDDSDGSSLLAHAAGGEPGAAELDEAADKINAYAAKTLKPLLAAARKRTGRTDLAIGSRLGKNGFHLTYGVGREDRQVFVLRPLWLRWLRHWLAPWKHD